MILFRGANSELIDLANPQTTPSSIPVSRQSCFACWDFDGDGIAECLDMVKAQSSTQPSQTVDVMAVSSITGQQLGYVRGHPMGPRIARGDFNGDGRIDLLMAAESPYSADQTIPAQAFDVNGKVLFTAPPEWNSPYVAVGDVDQDGCDEAVAYLAGQPTAFGFDGKQEPFSAWISHFPESEPSWFADLNGDGVDEAVSSGGAVLDYVNNRVWQLELPAGWTEMYVDGLFGPSLVAGSFPGFPGVCIAAIPAEKGIESDTFVIWQGDGKLVYCEYFGEIIEDIGLATTTAGEHVVLLTGSKLAIWP